MWRCAHTWKTNEGGCRVWSRMEPCLIRVAEASTCRFQSDTTNNSDAMLDTDPSLKMSLAHDLAVPTPAMHAQNNPNWPPFCMALCCRCRLSMPGWLSQDTLSLHQVLSRRQTTWSPSSDMAGKQGECTADAKNYGSGNRMHDPTLRSTTPAITASSKKLAWC